MVKNERKASFDRFMMTDFSVTVFFALDNIESTVLNGARGAMVERTARSRYTPGAPEQSKWDKFGCSCETI